MEPSHDNRTITHPPNNCCYHAAVLWRRERAERVLGRTNLAVNDGALPARADYEDKNTVRRTAAATFESARRLAKSALAVYSYQPTGSESEEYHKWYYNTFVWKKTSWMGITCWKSVSDMWNYQEILND